MSDSYTRRDVVNGGLLLGAALLLSGCQNGSVRADLPGPAWPGSGRAPPTRGADASLPPGVIPRSRWTSAPVIESLANPLGGVSRITVHHDGMTPFTSTNQAAATQRLESIRRAHVGRDWADIGYHYIIDPAGRVWEGRPIRYQGAHVKDHNERNLGVMVMGNFDQQSPTPAALARLDEFLAQLMHRHGVRLSQVHTHQELNPTACPGRTLQAYMRRTRASGGRLARA